MELQQISFLDSIMIEELSNFLNSANINHYKGDKMILFETTTFTKLLHRIEVDWESDDYILTIAQPNKTEKKLLFSNACELVHYIKRLQN